MPFAFNISISFVLCSSAYDKGHVINAEHVRDVIDAIEEKTNELTVIVYGKKDTSIEVINFVDHLQAAGSCPTSVCILEGERIEPVFIKR